MRDHRTTLGAGVLGAVSLALASGCGSDSSGSSKHGDAGVTADGASGSGGSGDSGKGGHSGAGGGSSSGGTASSGDAGNTTGGAGNATGGAGNGTGGSATGTGGIPGSNGCSDGSAPTGNGPRNLFPADHFFYKDVSCDPPSPSSDAIIGALGQWGNGDVFQIDFGITVLSADGSTPTRTPAQVTYSGDSDLVPFPFPAGGALEGESGYACTGGGDCHLLVIEQDTRQLFEAWAVDSTSSTSFDAGGTVVWDLDKHYGVDGRGAGCTSADAAGFPIVPGLIGVDEVAAEDVRHALRFILPNSSMRRHAYVYPATHYGSPSSRNPDSPPYGVRFRLKASFDETSITSAGGRAVVRALKRYGMLLSDGGQIALTAESDQFTTAKWRDNGGTADLGSHDLDTIQVSDFEVVDFGTVVQAYPIDYATNEWPNCVRAP